MKPEDNQLTTEEIRILKRMVKERQRKGDIPTKILFDRTKTGMKTIRLPAAMIADAAKREPNFNRLMEYLLWEFLGKHRKYLVESTDLDNEE
jgi:hypothetical protein